MPTAGGGAKIPDVTNQDIAAHVKSLRENFKTGATRDLQAQGEPALKEALWKDLHKHPTESYAVEFSVVYGEVQDHLDCLDAWTAPERVTTDLTNLPGLSYIHRRCLAHVSLHIACIRVWGFRLKMTRPRRQMLASLVPVKTRNDPLQSDAIPTTDYFRSSALSLHSEKPRLHIPNSFDDDDAEERRRTLRDPDAVRDIDNQIRHAQQEWRQHQEERFSARLALFEQQQQSEATMTTSRPPTVADGKTITYCSSDNNNSAMLLEQLNAIEKWIHSAGESLSCVESVSDSKPLRTSRQCYAMVRLHYGPQMVAFEP
ncbi:hypothetical protein FI667_g8613, partial [Globisporangium splendens]